MAQQPQWARLSPISRFHGHAQLDTPHSVELLWTSDQPDTENTARQHTILTRDRHP